MGASEQRRSLDGRTHCMVTELHLVFVAHEMESSLIKGKFFLLSFKYHSSSPIKPISYIGQNIASDCPFSHPVKYTLDQALNDSASRAQWPNEGSNWEEEPVASLS